MSAKLVKKKSCQELADKKAAFIKCVLYKDPLGSDTAATEDKSLRNSDLLAEAQRSTYLEQVRLISSTNSLRVVDPHLRQRKRVDRFHSIFLISRPFFFKG